MNAWLRRSAGLVGLIATIVALEGAAFAVGGGTGAPSFKYALYGVIAGRLGTLVIVLCAVSGVLCIIFGVGKGRKNAELFGYGVALLVIAGLVVGARFLITLGVFDYLELRQEYGTHR